MTGLRDRAARLNLSFPLEFHADGETLHGNCLNVSESGLLGTFLVAPELWTTGHLRLHFGRNVYELTARVARVNDREAGLVFSFRDDAEREVVRAMVLFAAERTHLVGLPPF